MRTEDNNESQGDHIYNHTNVKYVAKDIISHDDKHGDSAIEMKMLQSSLPDIKNASKNSQFDVSKVLREIEGMSQEENPI